MKRLTSSTDADTLLDLRNRLSHYFSSEILNTRLEFNEQDAVLDYIKAVLGEERCYPHFLPTQASGRWSVTKPPLVNWPPDIRSILVPDPGWPWIAFDLDAIEAKIVAALSHDREDLEAFNKGYDIHTIACCKMTGMELPPNLLDPHQSPECAEWRAKLKWQGKDDRRRVLAKVRYCLLYGKDASAVHGSKYERDMVRLGFKREDMMKAAQLFLRSKPGLVSTKRKYWDKYAKEGESRTIFGRRRRLFGDYWSRAKEGFNHLVQGSVTDMVNTALIELCSGSWTLVYPSHDAAKVSVPMKDIRESHPLQVGRDFTLARFKHAVEREYIIDGEKIVSSATWHIHHSDGSVEDLDSTTGVWKLRKA